jgi:molybdopterin-dependent oxidoreductase alpha subunit
MSHRDVPREAEPAPGTVHFSHPVGGWGSVEGIARIEAIAKAGPGAVETLARQNKPGGYMCSSCAWSKPPQPHVAEFCESGAKATIWDLTSARCGPGFFRRHRVAELAGWSDHELEREGRLTHPLRYDAASDRYLETSWAEAFATIGESLRALEPKTTTFYASGKAGLEAAYLYALFARVYGHNNLPDSSNMCHETTSVALKQTLGSPVGTCTMQDFEHCDAIFYVGQNPGTNSPRILHPLKDAVQRGCEIVVFNPLKERGLIEFADPQNPWQMTVGRSTPLASQYVQVASGGDIAALSGVAKHVLELDAADRAAGGAGVLDRVFLAAHTHGFGEWRAAIEALDWAEIEAASGVARAELERAAGVYVRAKAVMGVYGMGLTQHVHGSQAIGALVNLLLLRGNIGRPGAGCNPVRGHSNVQGQRTVGITEKPELAPSAKYRELYGFEPPAEKGHNTTEFIEKLLNGEAKGFIGLGGNLARAVPDWDRVAGAWRGMELTVHVATRLNRTHLLPGKASWLLPCLVRAEEDLQATGAQQVSMEDSFSHVYGSIGRREPASSHLRSETAIVCGLAKATLPENPRLSWDAWTDDYRLIRAQIEKTWPDMFADMERRMNQPGGFYRGNPAHDRIWKTKSGKAEFTTPSTLDATGLEKRPGRYRLITLRSNDQFNTTIYGYNDRLRGIEGERDVVMISPADIEAPGLSEGQRVALVTDLDDGAARRVDGLKVIPYDLPQGAVAGYYPELNALAPLSRRDLASGTPAAKAIPVRVES